MSLLQKIVVYFIAYMAAWYITLRLLVSYIRNPSGFPVKERKEAPKCLKDSSLGTHGYLSLKEIKIHYVEKGDRTKPLMLFVHGFPEFWYSWRYQIREFSKDYWTVAIDMRGYGDSEKPEGLAPYAMKNLVNDLKEIVEALGRQKCILVAHDWGGAIAWSFIQKHPDMIQSYIIMDAPYTPAFMEVVQKNRQQFLASWYIYFYQLPHLPELLLRSFDLQIFEPVFRGKNKKSHPTVTDEDIEAFKYNFSEPGALTPPINYYRANFFTSASNRQRKKTVDTDAPGLFIFGEFDPYLVSEHMDIAKKYVPHLKLKVAAGANHFVQQDDPDKVNQYMREFLQSI